MRLLRRTFAALLTAFVVGIALGAFKGDSSGLRGAIGNLSAPWLLVAFLPAVGCRTAVRGAVMGLASTMAALVGFYAALALVLAGHLGGGGHIREFAVEAGANRIYFLAGLVTGPLLGAIGAWMGRRHPGMVGLATGTVMAGEILAVALVQGHQIAPPPLYLKWAVDAWPPYVAECALGLGIIVVTLTRRRLSDPGSGHP
jgi:Family of unknown function (DUF6518)